MKDSELHIVFSGGATGGHLFSGLAVAERIADMVPRAQITFCGVGKPFEKKYVARAGFDYFNLPSRPLPRSPREAVAFLVENLAAYMAAGRFLDERNVAAVVGLGGYSSAPMAKAAAQRGVPLVLLEQNAVAGKATRWLARRAALVCTAFDKTAGLNCRCPVRVTGNPVRRGFRVQGSEVGAEIADQNTSAIQNPKSKIRNRRLLVLGGSGGARSLNESVPRALYKIKQLLDGWQIVHQSGEADYHAVRTLYAKFDLPAATVPFASDMPKVLSQTDFAVCRAGGTTLAELAAVEVPAILLPYPHAADDHQAANARHYAAGGGCVTIDERKVAGRLDDELADMLCFLLANDDLRRRMSTAMGELARPQATDDVAELIWSIASSRSLSAELAIV